jgi:hypothetical protein
MIIEDKIYTKEQIIAALEETSLALIKWVSEQENNKFGISADKKWSTGQQLSHLTKSIEPLIMILRKPKFVMRLLFGKSNRETRSYLAVVEKYNSKLAQGGVSTSPFSPKAVDPDDKRRLLNKYTTSSEKLEKLINKYSEKDLDKYILPHPLLGKLTLREMMFFTIYHTRHHTNAIKTLYPKAQH